MGETYYDVLEVAPNATDEEIRAAYRERVLETHPDRNDAADAAAQFDRVSTARDVLADGTERARYDRLGHDSYVRLARGTADSSASDAEASSSDDPTGRSTDSETGATGTARRSATAAGTEAGTDGHHARHRRRRQRKTARQRAAGEWSAGFSRGDRRDSSGFEPSSGTVGSGTATGSGAATGGGTATGPGSSRTTGGGSGAATTVGAPGGSGSEYRSNSESESAFRYAVHDWEGDVDLEWEGGTIDHSTAVTIGCLWLLYPVLVASSLATMFPLAVNATVAACTICLVGYLLTTPRIAIAVFGFWSLLVPMGLFQGGIVPPTSLQGLLALGFVWVPFGYAVALWWALQP